MSHLETATEPTTCVECGDDINPGDEQADFGSGHLCEACWFEMEDED